MAEQKTVKAGFNWESLNSLSQIPVGKKINAQVVSGGVVRVVERDTKPENGQHGFQFDDMDWISVKEGSKEVWVSTGSLNTTALIEVYG